MDEPLVLTFDIGTQSLRAMLVNPQGNTVGFVQERFEKPYFSNNPGWAEQNPDFYYEVLCRVSTALCERHKALLEQLIGVTITTIRDTSLCLDEHNQPLRDIILWLDKREAMQERSVKGIRRLILRAVGMETAVCMLYHAAAANWIMENQPGIWEKTAKFVVLSTYMHYKLTGVLKDCAANMIGHFPFDYKNRKWQGKRALTRCVCDIPREKLCELVEGGSVIGRITKEVSARTGIPQGLPLIATGSDKGCETLGLSVIEKHQAALSFGTTATIQFATKDYFEPQQFMPAYPAVIPDMYNPEVEIFRGYWLVSWFKREFASRECMEAEKVGISAEEILNKRLNEVPAGCEGLMLQPFWSPGIIIPHAKGAIIGFTDVHTRIHIYRAIIEGIGFALMDGMLRMEQRSGQKITELLVGGGGSKSDEICQITANMFGMPVKRIQTHEVSGLGSSIAAFVALGVYPDFCAAMQAMVHAKEVFMPDEVEHELYTQLYLQVYVKLFKRLEPMYKTATKLTRRER